MLTSDDTFFPGVASGSGIDKKSAQAMHAVGGRKNWFLRELQTDDSGFTPEQKILQITRAHESLHHLGGREGVVSVLREANLKWRNMDLDVAFLVRRCEFCLAKTTRGVNVPEVRRLPRPLHAGEILGVDLKKVTPVRGQGCPWTMLLVVDFASNKLWCYDLDDDKPLCFQTVGVR